MAMKIFDLSVVADRFVDARTHEVKHRYQQIGVELEDEQGRQFLILYPWINLAGLQREPGKSGVVVSKFPPKQQHGSSS